MFHETYDFICLIRPFSVIIVYVKKIFATIRLRSFFSNIKENEVYTKIFDRIFKKINTYSPS